VLTCRRPARTHHLAHLDDLADGYTTGSRRGRRLRGDLDGPGLGFDVDHPVAGEQFLGLGVRAVGHHRGGLAVADDKPGQLRSGQALGVDQLTGFGELGVHGDLEVDVRLDVRRVPVADRLHPSGPGVILQQHEPGHR
jgi:hypothetical protein